MKLLEVPSISWNDTSIFHCYPMRVQSRDCHFSKMYAPLIVAICLAMVSGLVNNTMSLLVFFTSKYKTGLLSLCMRFYYVFSMMFVITGPLTLFTRTQSGTSDLKKGTFMCNAIVVEMVYGTMLAMASTRCLYLLCPLQLPRDKDSRRVAAIVVVVIIVYTAGYHLGNWWNHTVDADFHYLINVRLRLAICLYLSVAINVLATVLHRYGQPDDGSVRYRMLRRLNKFTIISTVLAVVTSTPLVITMFIPKPAEVTCHYCRHYMIVDDSCLCLAYWNVSVDNFVYCLLSKKYRADLATILKKKLGWDFAIQGGTTLS